jgi:hypothetical protein
MTCCISNLSHYSHIQENLTINFYGTNDKNWNSDLYWKVIFNSCNKYGELFCWRYLFCCYFKLLHHWEIWLVAFRIYHICKNIIKIDYNMAFSISALVQNVSSRDSHISPRRYQGRYGKYGTNDKTYIEKWYLIAVINMVNYFVDVIYFVVILTNKHKFFIYF